MTIPIGAILAGLGRGASELGDRMDRNEALRRQRAMDALNEAVTFRKMGARVLRPDETENDAFVASPASQAVGRARTPDAIAALVNQGVQPDQNQTVTAQLPDPVTGATRNIFIDPTQSDDARAEQRAIRQLTMTQSLQGQRETALEAMRERSRHDEKLDDRRFDLDKLTRTENFTAAQNRLAREAQARRDAERRGEVVSTTDVTDEQGSPRKLGVTRSGKTIDIGGGRVAGGAGRGQAQQQMKLADVDAQADLIDRAAEAVAANPTAFGMKNKLPSLLRERLPGRDNAADASAIGALEGVVGEARHSRFGGALTPMEAEKAARIFADPTSPSDVILAKLAEVKALVAARKGAMVKNFGVGEARHPESAGASLVDRVLSGRKP